MRKIKEQSDIFTQKYITYVLFTYIHNNFTHIKQIKQYIFPNAKPYYLLFMINLPYD